MGLKCGTIIPFQYKDIRKLIAISGAEKSVRVTISDVKNAVYSAFTICNCKFYNKKIGFPIPDELLVAYLEQRHDLANFVIEIVEGQDDLRSSDPGKAVREERVVEADPYSSTGYQVKRAIERFDGNDDEGAPAGKRVKEDHLNSSESKNNPQSLDEKENLLKRELFELLECGNPFRSSFTLSDSRKYLDAAVAVVRGFPGISKSVKRIAGGGLTDPLNDVRSRAAEKEKPGCLESETINDWVLYFKAWSESYEIRTAYVRHLHQPLEYFEKFMANTGGNVVKLIEYDFERLHPGKGDKFLGNWDKFGDIVFIEAIESCRNDVPMILDLYGNMSQLCGLMMLGYFLENYENDMEPFQKDGPGNLIVHLETIDGKPVDVFKEYCVKREQSHPMAFVTGTSADELSFYVLFGDSLYSMETALKAIDFCFKCYQVMALSYPKEQKKVWQVIQSVLYEIKLTNSDPACDKFLSNFESF